MPVSFQANQQGIQALFFDKQKPVQRYLESEMRQVLGLAIQNAPVGKTGNLRRNQELVPLANGYGVICTVPYAFFVHEGTEPHQIESKTTYDPETGKGGWLVWENALGETIFYNTTIKGPVEHPGTDPDPWLLRALESVVGK